MSSVHNLYHVGHLGGRLQSSSGRSRLLSLNYILRTYTGSDKAPWLTSSKLVLVLYKIGVNPKIRLVFSRWQIPIKQTTEVRHVGSSALTPDVQ